MKKLFVVQKLVEEMNEKAWSDTTAKLLDQMAKIELDWRMAHGYDGAMTWHVSQNLFYNVILKKDMVVKLKTDKGLFYAEYNRIPNSLIRELASLKAGDKIDIFFRIMTVQLYVYKEQVKCFYDVKIHEGDIMRFKQCLWHEEMPVIARIDMVKAKYGLPLETKKTKKMPRFKNWMKPKKTEEINSGIVGFWLPSYQSFDIIVG